MSLQLKQFRSQLGDLAAVDAKLLIPVVFPVIHDGNTGKHGSSIINSQMDVLNRAFAGSNHAKNGLDTHIQYKLQKITYVENADWYENCKSSSYTFRPKHNVDSKS